MLCILQNDRRDKMEKMTLARTLPVLIDTFDATYADTYSASDAHGFNFFDARGCLVENDIETGKRIAIDPERIRAVLRSMSAHS